MSVKKNLAYFWSFYKWLILAALVVVILGIYLLCTSLFQKECVLSVMLMDCHSGTDQKQMEKELLQALQLEGKKYTIEIQMDLMFAGTDSGSYAMTSLARFLADIGSEKLDVCGMLEENFWEYERSGTFLDLRECLKEEQLQALEEFLVTSEDGRIVGLFASDLPGMRKDGCYGSPDGNGIIGIAYNTRHLEMAKGYILYLAGVTETGGM